MILDEQGTNIIKISNSPNYHWARYKQEQCVTNVG